MDGELWHEMYRSKWPIGIQLEGKIDWEELSLEVSYIMLVYAVLKILRL